MALHRKSMSFYRTCICAWYPLYETETYFVPPVVITRIPFHQTTVAGQSVLVPHSQTDATQVLPISESQNEACRVQESHTRDDLALQQVLFCLRELADEQKNEPMFVISQLEFSRYLGKPCYAAAAKLFVRPVNLAARYRQGDFDILLIHRRYGILIGEIKSVRSNYPQLPLTQQNADKKIAERLRLGLKQLNKSEIVLRAITKDIEPGLTFRKTVILPYVTSRDLKRVLNDDKKLQQDLVTCLQAKDIAIAVQLCLLADNLPSCSEEWHIRRFQAWWKRCVAISIDTKMKSNVYLNLLARFCGPATTISVYSPTPPRLEARTEGEGVAVIGERMATLMLTPEQVDLLVRSPAKVMLTGPPGGGKTVMLVLAALKWLRHRNDVHIVSVDVGSLAVSKMIMHSIKETLHRNSGTSAPGEVHLHEYDFYNNKDDVDKATDALTAAAKDLKLYIIMDEFWNYGSERNAVYHRFITGLCTRLASVYIWVAAPFSDSVPGQLQKEEMSIPLRCPPSVLKEVVKSLDLYGNVPKYNRTALASPCDGPKVLSLKHKGPKHTERWPVECEECGRSVAMTLERLCVGRKRPYANTNFRNARPETSTVDPPPLHYRDVFVLTRSEDLRDDPANEDGQRAVTPNGVVRGLRAKGIPVRVIRKGRESEDLSDTAVTLSDKVTVANYVDVLGLERKVVVYLPHRRPGQDDGKTDAELEARGRLHAMSRSTSYLVVVDVALS